MTKAEGLASFNEWSKHELSEVRMAYNYDREQLWIHQATVKDLKELAATGEVSHVVCETPRDLRREQRLVNNLLAVMSLYVPDYREIRDRIRTWSEYREADDKWILYVGRPDRKLAGNKPQHLARGVPLGFNQSTAERVHIDYPGTINRAEQLDSLGNFLAEQPKQVLSVKVNFAMAITNLSGFDWVTQFGWTDIEQIDTFNIRFRRPPQ